VQDRGDNSTGHYTILLKTTDTNPFIGDFRININLLNPDTGTNEDYLNQVTAVVESLKPASEPATIILFCIALLGVLQALDVRNCLKGNFDRFSRNKSTVDYGPVFLIKNSENPVLAKTCSICYASP
jgi:hypothetical protein